MRLIFGLAILAFPIAEIWILINLAHQYGWWLLFYLVIIAILGLQLIRDEKTLISGRVMQSLSQGGNPMKAMFGSLRNIIAGILLIIPGVMSDAIAVVLLLTPIKQGSTAHTSKDTPNDPFKHKPYQKPSFKNHRQASNDDVIEGEFTEIKEEPEKK